MPDCAVGAWRSPNVEQLQLKRQIKIGFVNGPDGIIATGEDADTPFIPDQICKVTFSRMVWKECGMNHGRPCYEAEDRAVEAPAAAVPTQVSALDTRTMLAMSVGVALGVLAVLVAQRVRP